MIACAIVILKPYGSSDILFALKARNAHIVSGRIPLGDSRISLRSNRTRRRRIKLPNFLMRSWAKRVAFLLNNERRKEYCLLNLNQYQPSKNSKILCHSSISCSCILWKSYSFTKAFFASSVSSSPFFCRRLLSYAYASLYFTASRVY